MRRTLARRCTAGLTAFLVVGGLGACQLPDRGTPPGAAALTIDLQYVDYTVCVDNPTPPPNHTSCSVDVAVTITNDGTLPTAGAVELEGSGRAIGPYNDPVSTVTVTETDCGAPLNPGASCTGVLHATVGPTHYNGVGGTATAASGADTVSEDFETTTG